MFQLRIYTLRSREALQQYAAVHWTRHLTTFEKFGITTHGVWTQRGGGVHQLVALIRYPEDAEPDHLASQVMSTPQFADDMTGFDVSQIVKVQSLQLDPTSFSPLQ